MATSRPRAGRRWCALLTLATSGSTGLLDLEGFSFANADAGRRPPTTTRPNPLEPSLPDGSAELPVETDSGALPDDGADEAPSIRPNDVLLAWRLPCAEVTSGGLRCFERSGRDPCPEASVGTQLPGDPNSVYDVVFRIAGVVEPRPYTGGSALDAQLYRGGSAAGPERYYELSISDPAATYYLNHVAEPSAEPSLLLVDYRATIAVRGGASLGLSVGSSCYEHLANCVDSLAPECVPFSVPGVTLEPREQALFVIGESATVP